MRRFRWRLSGLVPPFVWLRPIDTGEKVRLRLLEFGRFCRMAHRRQLPLGEALRRALWLLFHVQDALARGGHLVKRHADGTVTDIRLPWE